MGLKVSPNQAARLVGKTERTIRQWIADGRLPAQPAGRRRPRSGVGPYRWMIDTDDLARMPGIAIDPTVRAELEAHAALQGTGRSVLERLERVEREVADLRRAMDELRTSRSENTPTGSPPRE